MTRSTDGVYGSGNRSAIQPTNSDRRGRPGDPLRSNPTPVYASGDRNPEKYYGNQTVPGPAIPQGKTTVMPAIREGVARLQLKSETDVNTVRDQAIDALKRNARAIITVDGDDNTKLERLLRTQMELAVARQQITEGQFRDVYFNMGVGMPDVEEMIDDIPMAEDDGDPLANDIPDFNAFVKRKDDDDDDDFEIGVDPGAPEGDQTAVQEVHLPIPADHIELKDPMIIGDPASAIAAVTAGEDPKPVIESLIPEYDGPDETFDDEPVLAAPPRRAPRRSQG